MTKRKYAWICTTCIGDPAAWNQLGGAGTTSMAMRERKELLEQKIIPAALEQGFDDLIVGGRTGQETCDMFPDVTFVEIKPHYLDRREAFHIRDVCTEFYTDADVIVYQADDHMLGPDFLKKLKATRKAWAVLTPRRLHGVTGEDLNNGGADGYSGYHCHAFRRWVWEKVPFMSVDLHAADVSMSRMWREVGAVMLWPDEPTVTDLEIPEGVK